VVVVNFEFRGNFATNFSAKRDGWGR
jgi:hypothetical protein